MSVSFRPAKRENVPLLIGLAGGTGSGKTMSALLLAKGLSAGKPFALLDTENGRALHYADEFDFHHANLHAPFRPDAYAEAVAAADKAGYPVIVVDSMSHEHAGDGGLLDWHEEELNRMAGDDWKRREAMKMSAWIRPKMSHKAMVSRLLQVRAHVILCFRAEEKVEIVKEAGKTVVRPKQTLTGLDGWVPVCEKNLPYEMTLSFLLTALAPGVPRPIKLQQQHRAFVPLDRPIGEQTGAALAAWAAGTGKDASGVSLAASPPSRPAENRIPDEQAGASAVTGAPQPTFDPGPVLPPDEVLRAFEEAAAATPNPLLSTQPQRKLIFATATEHGITEARLREIILDLCGVESTKDIPRRMVDAVLAAIRENAYAVPPDEPSGPSQFSYTPAQGDVN
jgi:hypothetical protein